MGGVIGAEYMNEITANMEFTTYSIPGFLYWTWLAGCVAIAAYFTLNHLRGERFFRFAYPAGSEAVRIRIKSGERCGPCNAQSCRAP